MTAKQRKARKEYAATLRQLSKGMLRLIEFFDGQQALFQTNLFLLAIVAMDEWNKQQSRTRAKKNSGV